MFKKNILSSKALIEAQEAESPGLPTPHLDSDGPNEALTKNHGRKLSSPDPNSTDI